MSGIFLLLIAAAIFMACVIGIFRLKSWIAKIVLGLLAVFLAVYLVWNIVMAIFVGPSLRKM